MSEIMDRLVQEAAHECRVGIAKNLIAHEKLSLEESAEYSGLSVEEVRRLAEERENDEHTVHSGRVFVLQF